MTALIAEQRMMLSEAAEHYQFELQGDVSLALYRNE